MSANDPALASASAAYARLLVAPISLDLPPATTETGVHELIARIQSARSIAEEVTRAVAPLKHGSPPTNVAALVLDADTLDAFASRVASATLPLAADLARQIGDASPDVQQEVDRMFHERITESLVPQARDVFCLAAHRYQRVLEADPTNARATAQLAAYGDAFVASCP